MDNKKLRQYSIHVPEIHVGSVVGKLSSMYVELIEITSNGDTALISTQPTQAIDKKFEKWLLDITDGTGVIESENVFYLPEK